MRSPNRTLDTSSAGVVPGLEFGRRLCDYSARSDRIRERWAMEGERITLADAARLLPRRTGKHVSIHALKRWIIAGVRGGGIRLQAEKTGGIWYTTAEALQEFTRRCTERAGVRLEPTPAERSRKFEVIKQRLIEEGIYKVPKRPRRLNGQNPREPS